MSHLLEVADLAVHAAHGPAIRVPTLSLDRGECAALFGPSGAGKSSVLAAMFGLLRRAGWSVAGRVVCQGQEIGPLAAAQHQALLRRGVVFLPQDAPAALDPLAPVGQQLIEATGCSSAQCVAMLTRLGVEHAEDLVARAPHAISGGQAQRVLLAIAFLRSSPLVVVDEPSAGLDGGNYTELVAQLRALRAMGSAVLMATHDPRLLRDMAAVVFAREGEAFVRAPAPVAPWPQGPGGALDGEMVLVARGVRHRLGGRWVLDGVELQCRRGEIVAIIGASGVGKTTLVRVLGGHVRADAGEVTGPARPHAVQLVCQDAYASLTPCIPLRRLLAEAHAKAFDAADGAAAVGLSAVLLDQPRERMSGGEHRRAALLRALAMAPEVLILDEPLASLDRDTALVVLQSLLALQHDRRLTMVVVTHDEAMARAIAHRVLLLQGGRLCPA